MTNQKSKKPVTNSDRQAKRDMSTMQNYVGMLWAGKNPIFEQGKQAAMTTHLDHGDPLNETAFLNFIKKNLDPEYYEGYIQAACMIEIYKRFQNITFDTPSDNEALELTLERWNMPNDIAACVLGVTAETLDKCLTGKSVIPEYVWVAIVKYEAIFYKHTGQKIGDQCIMKWAENEVLKQKQKPPITLPKRKSVPKQ